jgi:hypothetical protein
MITLVVLGKEKKIQLDFSNNEKLTKGIKNIAKELDIMVDVTNIISICENIPTFLDKKPILCNVKANLLFKDNQLFGKINEIVETEENTDNNESLSRFLDNVKNESIISRMVNNSTQDQKREQIKRDKCNEININEETLKKIEDIVKISIKESYQEFKDIHIILSEISENIKGIHNLLLNLSQKKEIQNNKEEHTNKDIVLKNEVPSNNNDLPPDDDFPFDNE